MFGFTNFYICSNPRQEESLGGEEKEKSSLSRLWPLPGMVLAEGQMLPLDVRLKIILWDEVPEKAAPKFTKSSYEHLFVKKMMKMYNCTGIN